MELNLLHESLESLTGQYCTLVYNFMCGSMPDDARLRWTRGCDVCKENPGRDFGAVSYLTSVNCDLNTLLEET